MPPRPAARQRHPAAGPAWASAPTVAALAATVSGATVVEADAPSEHAQTEVHVLGATLDSRRVEPGWLYAGLPGATTHGARFAAQAAESGAVAVLTDPAGADLIQQAGVLLPLIVVDDPRAHLGALAAIIYRQPAESLLLFGVTGTNGKTTTTFLLHSALAHLNRHPGLIGTVETRIGNERVKSVRTTPESPDLHALFGQMLAAGADSCAMEISSHALALHRVDAVVVDIAGFTNLSQDHLDFHDTFEDYYAAKAALFTPEHASAAVICVDDEWGTRLATEASVPVTTVLTRPDDWPSRGPRLDHDEVDFHVVEAVPDPNGPGMLVLLEHSSGEQWQLISPLPGDFNVSNTVLAALMLLRAGFDPGDISAALAAAPGVPGRMEVVADTPDLLAVVDYAHSPDSIAASLHALRSSGSGPLVIVVGAGGDRDRGKRGPMGAVAVENADGVVITDDNPRSEIPADIRAAVLAGASQARAARPGVLVEEIEGRRAAIERGIALVRELSGAANGEARPGRPTVLVAGKGHESGQEVSGTVHPFDDRLVLAEFATTAPAAQASEPTAHDQTRKAESR